MLSRHGQLPDELPRALPRGNTLDLPVSPEAEASLSEITRLHREGLLDVNTPQELGSDSSEVRFQYRRRGIVAVELTEGCHLYGSDSAQSRFIIHTPDGDLVATLKLGETIEDTELMVFSGDDRIKGRKQEPFSS